MTRAMSWLTIGLLMSCTKVASTDLASSLCDRLDECSESFDYDDIDDCVDDYTSSDLDDCDVVKDEASGCLDELDDASCDDINGGDWRSECDEVYDCDGDEVGIGGAGRPADNVAACEAMLEAISCGESLDPDTIACEVYSQIQCNLVDYFTCITDAYYCEDGVASVDAEALSNCPVPTCGGSRLPF